jgi:hypothetical protein
MEFRVEHEIKVVRTVVKHVHGPCLMCGRETEYGKRIPPLGMAWLRKQFEPDTHRRDVRAVRIGIPPKGRSLQILEALLCADCLARLPNVRRKSSNERDAELQRRAALSHYYHTKDESGAVSVSS